MSLLDFFSNLIFCQKILKTNNNKTVKISCFIEIFAERGRERAEKEYGKREEQ